MGEDAVLQAHHEDGGELEALGRVQRHQHDARVVLGELVLVGNQADSLQQLLDGLVLARDTDELGQVLEPPLCLDGPFRFQPGGVPRAVEDGLQHDAGAVVDGTQVLEQGDHLADAREGPTTHARLLGVVEGLGEGTPVGGGPRVQAAERRVAHAALGHVDDPLERHLVGGVHHRPQVGEGVLHLAPVVEARAADHLVGQAEAHERLLHHPALGVGAVEDGHVAPPVAVVVHTVDLLHQPAGLVVLVLRVVALDELAADLLGPERLGLAHLVVGDDGVGGVEDRLGRAIVLFEDHERGVRERLLELQDVADVGAAEAVDALVAVAHHADVAVLLGQHHDQLVLCPVGVLELVDEHVAEAVPVVGQHVGVGAEHVDGDHEQVVEVHGAVGQQSALVLLVHLGDAPLEDRLGPLVVGVEVDEVVLGVADDGVHRARRETLGVDVQVAQDVGREALRVSLVVDGEVRAVPQALGVPAQDADTGGVERRDPHLLGNGTHQALHPALHLVCRLVGEGDGQHLERRDALLLDEPGDAVGEDPRLPRPGAGDDQQRAAGVGYRLTLDGVEILEQRGDNGHLNSP